MKIKIGTYVLIAAVAIFISCERSSMYEFANAEHVKIITADYNNGYIYISYDNGDTWKQYGNQRNWIAVTASSDGKKLAAAAPPADIFTSSDGGITWTERFISGTNSWSAITSSYNGSKIFAMDYNPAGTGYIFSSADSGATWATDSSLGASHGWNSVVCTPDGSRAIAIDGAYSGTVVYLFNGGIWSTVNVDGGTHQFCSLAASSDLSKIIIGDVNAGYLYISWDGGATWLMRADPGTSDWRAAAVSADGLRMVAAENTSFSTPGYIWRSTDGGISWIKLTGAGCRIWRALASSEDGTVLAAGVNGGFIYISTDGGNTWQEKYGTGYITCNSIVIAND